MPVRRATARITLGCNNRCVFCSQEGLQGAPSLPPEKGEELTFVGGEPTLAQELPERIADARANGYARVGVQTNGRRLADAGYAARLAAAGLTDVQVTVLGPDAASH